MSSYERMKNKVIKMSEEAQTERANLFEAKDLAVMWLLVARVEMHIFALYPSFRSSDKVLFIETCLNRSVDFFPF